MTTVPTGSPRWVHVSDHTTYGGDTEKTNYQSEGSINGKTDVSAQQFCRLAADLAAVGRTAPFAVIRYTQDDAGANDPTIDYCDSMVGSAPSAVRNGHGDVTLTWLADYTDPYGVSGDVHLAHALVAVEDPSAAVASVVLSDPDANGKNETARVRCFNPITGAAIQDKTVTLTVWTSVA